MKTPLAHWMICGLLAAGMLAPAAAADAVAEAHAGPPAISQAELLKRLESKDSDLVVLDVRTPEEFAAGHVPGAINLSHDQIATRIGEVEAQRDKQVVLYCRTGRRTLLAAEVLRKAGFTRLQHLEGDYTAWAAAHRPIETTGK